MFKELKEKITNLSKAEQDLLNVLKKIKAKKGITDVEWVNDTMKWCAETIEWCNDTFKWLEELETEKVKSELQRETKSKT